METVNGRLKPSIEEIAVMIAEHRKWRFGEGGGKRAYLQGAYLQGADLRGAYLQGADLRGAYLRGAYLQGADLRGAYLRGAYLQGADLQGADLRGAYLQGAYLQGADLQGADLRGAYLQGAYLQGADLQGAEGGITKKPVQISGFRWDILIMDAEIQIGCQRHSLKAWREMTDKQIKKFDPSASAEDLIILRWVIDCAGRHCLADEPVKEEETIPAGSLVVGETISGSVAGSYGSAE
jgi:hypothetical protein